MPTNVSFSLAVAVYAFFLLGGGFGRFAPGCKKGRTTAALHEVALGGLQQVSCHEP